MSLAAGAEALASATELAGLPSSRAGALAPAGALFVEDSRGDFGAAAAARRARVASGVKLLYVAPPVPPPRRQSAWEKRVVVAKAAAKLLEPTAGPIVPRAPNARERSVTDAWAPAPAPATMPAALLPSGALVPALPAAAASLVAGRKRARAALPVKAAEARRAAGAAADARAASSYNPSVEAHAEGLRAAAVVELNAAAVAAPSRHARTGDAALGRPVRAHFLAARRPLAVALTEELTGSLRTARRLGAAELAADAMHGIVSTGAAPLRLRRLQKKSFLSNKRSKRIEFPRKPAAAWAVIKSEGEAGAAALPPSSKLRATAGSALDKRVADW